MEIWLMQLQSICILALMFYGVKFHKQRTKHIKIMSTAMIWDVILILQIELSRGAVMKASKVLTNHVLLNIHVSLALTTVILYGFMIYTGRSIIMGQTQKMVLHKKLGYSTLIMRTLTFITSFGTVVN